MSWATVGKSKINVIEINYNLHKFLIKTPKYFFSQISHYKSLIRHLRIQHFSFLFRYCKNINYNIKYSVIF